MIYLLGTVRQTSTRCKNKMLRGFGNTSLADIHFGKMKEIVRKGPFSGFGMAIPETDRMLIRKARKAGIRVLAEKTRKDPRPVPLGETRRYLADCTDSQYVMWVNACLPFLKPSTVVRAAEVFRGRPGLLSLTAVQPRKKAFWFAESSESVNCPEPIACTATQWMSPIYESTDAFHIFDRDLLVNGSLYWRYSEAGKDPYLFVMEDQLESFDIDTEDEFACAEALWREGRR